MFVKACESTCILLLRILAKTQLRNPIVKPFEKCIYCWLPPPRLRLGQQQQQPPPPGHPNVLRLFIITIPKPILRAVFLSIFCSECFTIQVCQPTYDEIQSQLHSCFKCNFSGQSKTLCYSSPTALKNAASSCILTLCGMAKSFYCSASERAQMTMEHLKITNAHSCLHWRTMAPLDADCCEAIHSSCASSTSWILR